MRKLTIYPFLISTSVFGITACVTAVLYSLSSGDNLLKSDDPYVLGLVLACVNAIAALIFFILGEIKITFFKPIPSLIIYYCLLTIYSLFLEYIGGEASVYGYIFLASIALSLPILLMFLVYSDKHMIIYTGIVSGLIYLIGYTYVASVQTI